VGGGFPTEKAALSRLERKKKWRQGTQGRTIHTAKTHLHLKNNCFAVLIMFFTLEGTVNDKKD